MNGTPGGLVTSLASRADIQAPDDDGISTDAR